VKFARHQSERRCRFCQSFVKTQSGGAAESGQPAGPGFGFYQLEQKPVERGLTRQPGEPLSAWLQYVAGGPDLAGFKQPLHGLLLLHYRYRFDPQGSNQAERKALRREVETCLSGRKW
jgi:hypothetical protein